MDLAEAGIFKKEEEGKILKKEVKKDYILFNLKGFKKRKNLKIIIDTANSISGILIPGLLAKNYKIDHLFSRLDGSFPNHNPDPLEKENLKEVCRTVVRKKADLGIAFDGDGDRVFFIDEKGEIVAGDLILAIISQVVLKEKPGSKILYDIRSSNIVKEIIENSGGEPIGGRIGHSFIKEKMRRENILFGGELSGHYYSRDHYFCEAPFFVIFKLIELVEKEPLSEKIAPLRKYFHSGEINFKVEDKEKAMKALEKKFPKGKICRVDGLRIDFPNWWFLVRPSNTEPLLRLVVEGETKKLLVEKKKELSSFIRKTDRLKN